MIKESPSLTGSASGEYYFFHDSSGFDVNVAYSLMVDSMGRLNQEFFQSDPERCLY